MVVYDHSFNHNEWSVMIGLCIGLFLVFVLPKRFPTRASFVFFMCGVYSGFFFDNSLSIQPVSFYDTMDTSVYQVMDYILYFAYGPISYLFFYVWDYMRLKSRALPLYLFIWVLIAMSVEWIGTLFGVFHYRHGYKIEYSMPIYLVIFCLWAMLYRYYQILIVKGKQNLH